MTVWDFVKRHKGKIIAGGVLIGGALTFASQSIKHGNQAMLVRSYEADSLKIQARRHYVFDTNHRSCDQSLTDLVPSIKALVQSRFDVDLLIKELQDNASLSSQQKIDIWQKIKVMSISRLIGLAYAYSLLTVTLKAQISILAAEICSQFEQPSLTSGSWMGYVQDCLSMVKGCHPQDVSPFNTSSPKVDVASRQIFLQCIQYFTTRGIPQLLDLAERITQEECGGSSLMDGVNKEDVRSILDRVDRRLAVADSRHFSQFIAPLYEKDMQSNDGVLRLLFRLVSSIESAKCRETTSSLVDFYLSAAVHSVPNEKTPLAKVLPPLVDSFHSVSASSFDSPLQNSLCSSDVHQYAMSVFNMPLL